MLLNAEAVSGNEKIRGLALTKITFKLEHVYNTWTNETNNTTRNDGNCYEGNLIKERPWIISREICY